MEYAIQDNKEEHFLDNKPNKDVLYYLNCRVWLNFLHILDLSEAKLRNLIAVKHVKVLFWHVVVVCKTFLVCRLLLK
jgi:uncharacterized membrane protein